MNNENEKEPYVKQTNCNYCNYCRPNSELVDLFSIRNKCYIHKNKLIIKLGDEVYSNDINYCPKCGRDLAIESVKTYNEILIREG